MEWLESRQLLTAVAWTGDFGELADAGDPACADPNNAGAGMLPSMGDATATNPTSTLAGPPPGSAESAAIQSSITSITDFGLQISVTDNVGGSTAEGTTGTAVPGDAITYTIMIANDGFSDTDGASIVDSLPGTLSGATFTATETGDASGFTQSGSGSIDDTNVDLPAGSTVTYTLTANIASNATGTLSNMATVTPPTESDDDVVADAEPAGEPSESGGSATDSDTLVPEADLEITKSDNFGGSSNGTTGAAIPGDAITYTIEVTNNGPSDVTGASIVDSLPATLSGATFTAAETGNASGFSPSGSGSIDDTDVDLPAGSTVTYTLTANIASSATGTLSNSATVTPPEDNVDDEEFDDAIDLNVDDNSDVEGTSATDSDTLVPEADLEITKSDNLGGSSNGTIGTAIPGEAITYTIAVTNDGPSDVTGASIVDSLPGTLSGATFTAVETGDASGFTKSGSGGIDDTDVDLPTGSTVTYTLTTNIASSATGTLSNSATVTPPAGVTDTNAEDEEFDDTIDLNLDGNSEVEGSSATDSDTLTPETDLEITKGDNLGGSSDGGLVGTAVPGDA
ncbi:MAG TPA: hypothetical protein VGG30_10230, partial [Pirellulales bacterium]